MREDMKHIYTQSRCIAWWVWQNNGYVDRFISGKMADRNMGERDWERKRDWQHGVFKHSFVKAEIASVRADSLHVLFY